MSGSNSPGRGASRPPGRSRLLNRPRLLDRPRLARVHNQPRLARVRMETGGTPHTVDGRRVEQVRESWLVEDRWWTGRPLRRRYWEVMSAGGRNLVVFHDLCTGEWYGQAG